MNWTEPKYSKTKVRKSGKYFAHFKTTIDDDELTKQATIFLNWKASHIFPMQTLYVFLRRNALKIDKKAVTVQRLKRNWSIIKKLQLNKNMSLDRIEDIGGCRVVLEDIDLVFKLCNRLEKSKTKNELWRKRDYIIDNPGPKSSGYRGIHLIYRYRGGKEKFQGMPIELQIRSKIQHSWATAIEVVGAFTDQALKSSLGQDLWLDFFKYASAEFAKLEKCPINSKLIDEDTFSKMCECIEELDLTERLAAFKLGANIITKNKRKKNSKKDSYYILILNIKDKTLSYLKYNKNEFVRATTVYSELEKEHRENSKIDIVLVSAESLRSLKKAYPNYFSDTTEFENYIKMVYESNSIPPMPPLFE